MSRDRRGAVSAAVAGPLLLVILAVAIGIALQQAGLDVVRAGTALLNGAFGSAYAIHSATLVRATPLILTGLAVTIAFRAGVFNIGAEGQLLAGAAAACAVGLSLTRTLGTWAIPAMLLGGMCAGALVAGVAAWLRRRFAVLEVISTILLNFVVVSLVGYLVHGPMQEPARVYPQSSTLPSAIHLPVIWPGSRLHIGFALAIVACIGTWAALRYTAAGFRVRAVGANPDAARVAGEIDVAHVTTRAFLLSGAVAGLAGAIELGGVTFALYENLSPGYGFTAIAVALLARLNPLGVIGTGIAFGALEAGAAGMQRDGGVPSVVVAVLEAIIILLLAVTRFQAGRRGVSTPAARSTGSGTVEVPA